MSTPDLLFAINADKYFGLNDIQPLQLFTFYSQFGYAIANTFFPDFKIACAAWIPEIVAPSILSI